MVQEEPVVVEERTPERRDDEIAGAASATSTAPSEIYTVANMITLLRLLLVPFFFVLLITREGRYDMLAFVVFVIASSTDFLDGMIARRTGRVTALGKIIDPLVDRLLIAAGVVGLYVLDRIPLWIVLVLVTRDVYLLYGAWVLERHGRVLPVLVIGKITTAVLLVAFSTLIIGPRLVLPGGTTALQVGGYVLYVGLVMSLITAVLYTIDARRALAEVRAKDSERG
jgi:cardiolipin synthase